MTEIAQEISSQEGPASLREALEESFRELGAEPQTEPESTESVPTDDDAQPPANVEQEASDEPSEAQAQGEEDVILAPEHWSAEDREVFNDLPSAAQRSWLRREKEYEQGIQKKAEESKPLYEAFGRYRDVLRMRGIDEATAIRAWSAVQATLDSDPVAGLRMLINQFSPKVQSALVAEFGQKGTADNMDYDDPEVRQLKSELQSLRQQNEQNNSRYHQLRQQEALDQVRQFKEATDEKGALLHPHFDAVNDEMRALLQTGVVHDLQTAYDKAVWSLPAYREEFASKERREAEQLAAKRREEAAQRAKKAGKSVNGKNSVPPPPPKPSTMADDLRMAWDEQVKGAN